jgi:hypothetical protein
VMWPKKLVGILNGGIESPNLPRWNSFSMCLVSVWKQESMKIDIFPYVKHHCSFV